MSVRVRYTTRDGGLDTAGRDSHFVPAIGDAVDLTELGCPHAAYPHEWGRVVECGFFHFSRGGEVVTCIVEPCASPFDDPEGLSVQETTTDDVMDMVREYGNELQSSSFAYGCGNLGGSKKHDEDAETLFASIKAAIEGGSSD